MQIFVDSSQNSALVNRMPRYELAAFRFRNFRSFRDETELSLVAQTSDASLYSSLIDPQPDRRSPIRLVPAAAIYGPNAAGKTNVLLALAYMYRAVTTSQVQWKPDGGTYIDPFAGKVSTQRPSSFEVEAYIDGERFRYGFAATGSKFVDEWLYAYPLGRPRLLFQRKLPRKGRASIKIGKGFGGDTKYLEIIKTRVRDNSLFVSAAAQDNHPTALKVYRFFQAFLVASLVPRIDPKRMTLTCILASQNKKFKSAILTLLKIADPSISEVHISPVEGKSWDDYHGPRGTKEGFFEDTKRYEVSFTLGTGREAFRLPLAQQSQGVQKVFALAGEILGALSTGDIVLLDEIETSMHPMIARLIVDLFQSPKMNKSNAQIIFTTHDTNLLDQTLLRRDQIWFVERKECCSHLYPLTEFSPRKDADLERGYLRGRYGAIPIAGMPPPWIVEALNLQSG